MKTERVNGNGEPDPKGGYEIPIPADDLSARLRHFERLAATLLADFGVPSSDLLKLAQDQDARIRVLEGIEAAARRWVAATNAAFVKLAHVTGQTSFKIDFPSETLAENTEQIAAFNALRAALTNGEPTK